MGGARLAARARRWARGGALIARAPAAPSGCAVRRAGAGRAAARQGRRLHAPDVRDAPRRATPARRVRDRAARARAADPRRRRARRRRSSTSTAITLGRRQRARAALGGVRARLRDVGPLLRLPDGAAHAGAARSRSRVPALGREPGRRRPGVGPAAARDRARPRPRNHNGGQLAVRAGREAVAGDRRRRRRQQPVRPRAGPGLAARQADPAGPGGAGAGEQLARGLRNPWRFSFDARRDRS